MIVSLNNILHENAEGKVNVGILAIGVHERRRKPHPEDDQGADQNAQRVGFCVEAERVGSVCVLADEDGQEDLEGREGNGEQADVLLLDAFFDQLKIGHRIYRISYLQKRNHKQMCVFS